MKSYRSHVFITFEIKMRFNYKEKQVKFMHMKSNNGT